MGTCVGKMQITYSSERKRRIADMDAQSHQKIVSLCLASNLALGSMNQSCFQQSGNMADPSVVSALAWPPQGLPVAVCPHSDFDVDLIDADEIVEVAQDGLEEDTEMELPIPPWECLPPELLAKIFSHLDDSAKESVESTCLSWQDACQNPALWSSQVFSFSGDNCVQTVHQACRSIERKGYLLRHMTLSIGLPSLPQAWLLSQCVQQLLEFISRHPAARHITSLRVTRLNFFTHWRFFTLSKRNILVALSNFLLSQRHLAEVDLATCRLSADDGMRILRALTVSSARQSVKRLNLHDFFQSKYQATLGSRFSHLLTSSFSSLRHLVVDARHVDPNFLLALVGRSPARDSLHHVTIHFEAVPPRQILTDKCWHLVRQHSPDLNVTFVFQGRMPAQWARKILVPSVPLTELVVHWPRAYRHQYVCNQHLTELLERVSQLYPAILERFRLRSDIRATPEVELALIRLANDCRRLAKFNVNLKLTADIVQEVKSRLLARSRRVQFRFVQKKKVHKSFKRVRVRNRGSH